MASAILALFSRVPTEIMRSIFILAILIVVVTVSSAAPAKSTRPPRREKEPLAQREEKQPRGKGPPKVPKGFDKEARDTLRTNCKKKSNKCRDQTNEYRKTRQNVRDVMVKDFKRRNKAATRQEAEKQAELRLAKIQDLKRMINTKNNMSDIEPADDGLWQNDIILTNEQIEIISTYLRNPKQHDPIPAGHKQKRSASWYFEKNPDYLWKMPIRYWIDDQYNSTEQGWIEDALKTMMNNVNCLKFVRDTVKATNGSQMQYIKPDSCCCWGTSYVGCLGPWYVNPINIAVGCAPHIFKGRVFHETIHALGGGHEQSRTDRDYHIQILWENIDPQQWSQYQIDEWSTSYGSPYDYRSVMHYEQGGFALAWNLDTMRPYVDTELGNDYMSNGDVLQLRRMYCRSSTCTDNYQDCGNWANFQYCTDPERGPWMKQFCPRSCGAC